MPKSSCTISHTSSPENPHLEGSIITCKRAYHWARVGPKLWCPRHANNL